MIDYRMETFLTLCRTMNYRVTAEELSMTQPAVTQHIHFLERVYQCKLFTYQNRRLRKTAAAIQLETYGRSAAYNAQTIATQLSQSPQRTIRIGATKTIGDYVIAPQLARLLHESPHQVSLVVDNTQNLFQALHAMTLDVVLIEGYFDKAAYDFVLMRQENLVGICAQNHPFANQSVAMEDLFSQRLIVREPGSGTRAVFAQLLQAQNYGLDAFSSSACISSFEVIKTLVKANCGISFVYESIAQSDDALATFTLDSGMVHHEFNYVFLKNTPGQQWVNLIAGDSC